ncbi:CAP domain-containing protein [Fictibacillus sp. Mic-4]|uniref:CAP domain-containing protein n=1 Tax=Fictibacillus TaxID=1329200 RepID=UPI000421BEE3|nr:CAP domain-containing protein [Fictibacillus gelatini]
MKKLLVASILGASLIGVNAGVSHAAAPQTNNDCNVQFSNEDFNKYFNNEDFNNYIQELIQKYGLENVHVIKKSDNWKQEEAKPNKQVQVKVPEQAKAPEAKPAPKQPTTEKQQTNETAKAPSTSQLTADEKQMFDLVNKERQKAGVKPLEIDMRLVKTARLKSKDMIDKNYFDHNSPTYGSPFDMMKKFGISYNTAGENIAGNQTVQAAHTALMNSQGHRENILNPSYTKVGIGIVDGGPYGKMFTQQFIG